MMAQATGMIKGWCCVDLESDDIDVQVKPSRAFSQGQRVADKECQFMYFFGKRHTNEIGNG